MVDQDFNYERTARLIEEAVSAFDLDATELTVYTEAATGGFAVTAATAVAAGADTVYAIVEDSPYGPAEAARSHTERLACHVGDESTLVFPSVKRREEVREADVVTNTGFVRPIDGEVVSWLKPTAAVSLMYEPWEFRDTDMDIDALWAAGIPVLGTDESDGRVGTQQYLRSLATKVALDCDLEIYRGTFAVVGSGRMARHAAAGLDSLGATVERVDTPPAEADTDLLNSVPSGLIESLDALLLVDHETRRLLVGTEGFVDPVEFEQKTRGATIIHVCGPVSAADMDDAGVRYVPQDPAPAKRMSYTTGYLGPRPVVDLHAAGIRVGVDLAREQRAGTDFRTATENVAATSIGMDFDEAFKNEHGFAD
jgi:hypothetical protein